MKFNAFQIRTSTPLGRNALTGFSLIMSIPIIIFYGLQFPAALVNLPDSWIGIVYTILGMTIGVACLVNARSPNWPIMISAILATIPIVWILCEFIFSKIHK
jgi:hypothetical protein